jgi:geranylgeranyl pyrophosphate synthase
VSADSARQIIADVLKGAEFTAPFSELLLIPLKQPGRLLNDHSPSGWPQLIEACCKSVGGDTALLPPVIASFELCVSALDVLDEIEDDDDSPLVDKVGAARALNLTTSLLGLSNLILTGDRSLDGKSDVLLLVSRALSRAVTRATIGQDADLRSENLSVDDMDEVLGIASMKSGSLVGGACEMGAVLGSRDPEILERYHQFGVLFGTMAQIANDIHDVSRTELKSDQAKRKSTLPIAFAMKNHDSIPEANSANAVQTSGGLHFAWVIFETHRLRAQRILDDLERAGNRVESLRDLLNSDT